jgi:hypothetical protein
VGLYTSVACGPLGLWRIRTVSHDHRIILVIAFMAGVAWRVVRGDMLRGEAFHQELGRSGCDSWSDTNPVISKSFTTKKAMRVDFAKQFTKDC